jgi:hypothetical protein
MILALGVLVRWNTHELVLLIVGGGARLTDSGRCKKWNGYGYVPKSKGIQKKRLGATCTAYGEENAAPQKEDAPKRRKGA